MRSNRQIVRHGVQRWTVLFCVLVVAAFGFVQAVHAHPSLKESTRNLPASHCVICVASHSVAVLTNAIFVPVPANQPGTVLFAEPQLEIKLVLFTAFIRPPPPSV